MDHGKGIEGGLKGDTKGLREFYCWTDERIKLLIDIGRDYSRKGYKLNASFTEDGWACILKEYNQKCEKLVTMLQLKNRLNILNAVVADGKATVCTNEDDPPPTTPKGVSDSNSAVNLENSDSDDSNNDDLPIEVLDMKKEKKRKRRSSMESSQRSNSSDNPNIGEAINKLIALEERKTEDMRALLGMKKAAISGAIIDTTFDMAYQILNSLDEIQPGSTNHVMALEVLEDRNKRQAFILMHELSRVPWLLRAIERKAREESGPSI